MKQKKISKQKIKSIKKGLFQIGILGVISTIIGFILDKTIIRLANSLSFQMMNYIFITITTLGETYIFVLIAAVLTIALMAYRKPVVSFVLSIFSALFIIWLLKYIIDRPRPFEIGLTSAGVAANWSSFPSGHTLVFFTIIPMVAKKFPKLKTIFWMIAILVGLSRIYLGVHYASDVIAGAFIGYGIGWTFMRIEEKYRWSI
jgi:undecaprenyl-diphosphatase